MKNTGLPIQADAPDAALHIGCMRGRVTRARNGGFVSMRQLRHCIAGTVVCRRGMAQGLSVSGLSVQQKHASQPVGGQFPPSFLPLDRAMPARTRVQNSHRGVGLLYSPARSEDSL